jgi:hypothetical protein
VTTR